MPQYFVESSEWPSSAGVLLHSDLELDRAQLEVLCREAAESLGKDLGMRPGPLPVDLADALVASGRFELVEEPRATYRY